MLRPTAPADAAAASDARVERDAASPRDAASVDASVRADASRPDATALDASAAVTLSALRDRLFATFTSSPCERWTELDESQRAVFLTHPRRPLDARAHRAALSRARQRRRRRRVRRRREQPALPRNGRHLHARMVETWDGERSIDDGGGSRWKHTGDIAGPHDPFDASNETDTGLRCTLFIETSSSRPPTAQAHFFLDGSAEPVDRGDGISLPAIHACSRSTTTSTASTARTRPAATSSSATATTTATRVRVDPLDLRTRGQRLLPLGPHPI